MGKTSGMSVLKAIFSETRDAVLGILVITFYVPILIICMIMDFMDARKGSKKEYDRSRS